MAWGQKLETKPLGLRLGLPLQIEEEGTAVVRMVEHMGWEQLWGLCMQFHKWGGSFGPKIHNWVARTWFWPCHYKRQRDVMEGVSRVGCMG